MCPKHGFQLEILIKSNISAIHKFWENILESSRNVSETTPVHAMLVESEAHFNIKTIFPGMGIPVTKIRWPSDHFIFMMEILTLVRWHIHTKMVSWVPEKLSYEKPFWKRDTIWVKAFWCVLVEPCQLTKKQLVKRTENNFSVNFFEKKRSFFYYTGCNRMAWQWVETVVEIRGTLADIRGNTK